MHPCGPSKAEATGQNQCGIVAAGQGARGGPAEGERLCEPTRRARARLLMAKEMDTGRLMDLVTGGNQTIATC
jgi:hypothetical protein